jgi:hypothetical protein
MAEAVVREFFKRTADDRELHVLDLSIKDLPDFGLRSDDLPSDDRYGFTKPEWTQIQADFLALRRPLECKLSASHLQAVKFLCQVLASQRKCRVS